MRRYQLNGGTLDGASLEVSSEVAHQDEDEPLKEGVPLEQSDKPRAGSKVKLYLVFLHLLNRGHSRCGISGERLCSL
jgi:hypothetical protein